MLRFRACKTIFLFILSDFYFQIETFIVTLPDNVSQLVGKNKRIDDFNICKVKLYFWDNNSDNYCMAFIPIGFILSGSAI